MPPWFPLAQWHLTVFQRLPMEHQCFPDTKASEKAKHGTKHGAHYRHLINGLMGRGPLHGAGSGAAANCLCIVSACPGQERLCQSTSLWLGEEPEIHVCFWGVLLFFCVQLVLFMWVVAIVYWCDNPRRSMHVWVSLDPWVRPVVLFLCRSPPIQTLPWPIHS